MCNRPAAHFSVSAMKDKAMTKRKFQQNNLAILTPAFYTNEKDKIKLNWFLFEYAAELDSHIKRPLRKRLKRKNIGNRKIAEFCIYYSKEMKGEILDKLSGRIENVSLSYHAIEEFFPHLNDKLVDDLLTSAFDAWDSITSMCVKCPTRCISEKDNKASMFDDPMYYD
jgi:hypothetical protein